MPKIFRANFHEGSRFRGSGGEAEVRLLQNARIEGNSVISHRFPLYQTDTIPNDTVNIFRYRGRLITSALPRDYVAEFVNGNERVYFTEYGDYPKKQINGVETRLGIPRPLIAPTIDLSYTNATMTAPTVTQQATGTGIYMIGSIASFRIAAKTALGVLPPSGRTIATASVDNVGFQLTWSMPTRAGIEVTGYLVFGGDPDQERLLAELPVGSSTFTHSGSNGGYPDKASSYDQTLPYQYFYTFVQDFNGYEVESGPSPVSVSSTNFAGRTVIFNTENDGYWELADTLSTTFTATAKSCGLVSADSSHYGDQVFTGVVKPILDDNKGDYYFDLGSGNDLIVGDWIMVCGQKTRTISSVDTVDNNYELTVGSGHGYAIGDYLYVITGTNAGLIFVVQAVGTTTVLLTYPTWSNTDVRSNFSAGNTVGKATLTEISAVNANKVYVDWTVDADTWGTTTIKRTQWSKLSKFEWNGYRGGLVITTDTPQTFGPSDKLTISIPNESVFNGASEFECVRLSDDPYSFLVLGAPPTTNSYGTYTINYPYIHRSRWKMTVSSTPSSYPPDDTFVKVECNGLTSYGYIKLSDTSFYVNATPDTNMLGVGNSYTMTWIPSNNGVKCRRLYRVGDTTVFQQVEDLALDINKYLDYRSAQFLGDTCPSYTVGTEGVYVDGPAPDTLTGLVAHYDMLFGIDGFDVCWCDSGRPDGWPIDYRQRFPSKPIGLASFRQSMVVLCLDGIYRLDGNQPSNISISKTNCEEGCLSAGSIQLTNRGLIYLGKRGLYMFDGHNADCFTDERMTAKQMFGTAPYADFTGAIFLGQVDTKAMTEGMYVDNTAALRPQWLGTMPLDYNNFYSFIYRNCYFIYNASKNYAGSGTWIVDLEAKNLSIQHSGLSPLHVYVDEYQTVSVLMGWKS